MLLGLLADLHGDLDGFTAALAILAREGVGPSVCAGDVAERGRGADATGAGLATADGALAATP